MRRRATPLLVWGAVLVATTAALHALGTGALEPPPLDPVGWMSWAQARDPYVAVVGVLRLGALALSWYLLGATTIGVLARLIRAARLVQVADALTVPVLRRLLQTTLGVSLATMMVTTAAAPGASAQTSAVPIGPSIVHTAQADTREEPADAQPSLGSVRDVHPGLQTVGGDQKVPADRPVVGDARPWNFMIGDGDLVHDGSVTPEGSQVTEQEHVPTFQTSDYEVVSGESLWTIAHTQVAATVHREPTDGEVARYWRELIATNRDRLADPDNPDLIFPGQPLSLPPVRQVEP